VWIPFGKFVFAGVSKKYWLSILIVVGFVDFILTETIGSFIERCVKNAR